MNITNLVNKIEFQKHKKDYGITEIFLMDNEVYITSDYNVPFDIIEEIEKIVLN